MGLTSVRMQVANFAAPEIAEEVEFLVDSGAIYSVVPGELLARLGLAPRREREFRLANATRIVRGCGVALFRYGDRDAVAEVIFGEPGTPFSSGPSRSRRWASVSIRSNASCCPSR